MPTSCLQGLAAQSVNWGAWAGHGMAAKAGLERMARMGFGAVQPMAGMSALGCLLGSIGSAACGAQLLGSCFFWNRCAPSHAATLHWVDTAACLCFSGARWPQLASSAASQPVHEQGKQPASTHASWHAARDLKIANHSEQDLVTFTRGM